MTTKREFDYFADPGAAFRGKPFWAWNGKLEPEELRLGENELTLSCDYDADHSGLEMIYLLGAFGSELKGGRVTLAGMPGKIETGDWVKQGLTFYSGNLGYSRKIAVKLGKGRRLFVRVPDYRGVAVRVLVDGAQAGIIAWEPNEVEITRLVAGKKEVLLSLEVLGHRRNSHGPFYREPWLPWTGPAEYETGADGLKKGYQLVPCGIMKAPELVVKAAR